MAVSFLLQKCSLFNAFVVLLVIGFASEEAYCKLQKIKNLPGEICEMDSGMFGRCELASLCKRNRGDERWRGTHHICIGGSDERETYVCCRKPFQIAKHLCDSWKYFWRDRRGKCASSEPLNEGGAAVAGQFPEIAIVGQMKGDGIQWICGSTLISPHFVLTAAHCVLDKKKKYTLRFGEHDLDVTKENDVSRVVGPVPVGLYRENELHYDQQKAAPTKQNINVRRVICHPGYTANGRFDHDIALLELETPVVFTKRVLPVCLPVDPEETFMNISLSVAGWGRMGFNSKELRSRRLRKINIPVIPQMKCNREYTAVHPFFYKTISESKMCAGSKGLNSCMGDSGGPLALQVTAAPWSTPCEHTVVGIVSYGFGCTELSVYTRVTSYVPWITGYIAPKMTVYT